MVFLPTMCSSHHGVCFAETATHIWDIEFYHKNCDFSFYKQASFIRIEPKIYLDNGNKILIRFPEITSNIVTCDDRTLFQTAEGIWVSESPASKKLVKAISAIPEWNITYTPDLH